MPHNCDVAQAEVFTVVGYVPPTNSYLLALKTAALNGYYVPEIGIYYSKYSDFKVPIAIALDFGH